MHSTDGLVVGQQSANGCDGLWVVVVVGGLGQQI